MKPFILAFSMLCIAIDAGASGDPRQKVSLNADWSFAFELPERAAAAGLPAAARQLIDLPHSWNAADSTDKTKAYHRGIGSYRKSFFIEPSLQGKKLYLYFEGANQVADVAVNGRSAGRHVGGYSAFAFDISDLVRIGRQNAIEVVVDNRHNDDVPPLNADFTFYGGIYRDVWLLALNDVHFALDAYAATDLRIAPTSVSAQQATVEIDAGVANDSGRDREIRLDSSLVNADGSPIAEASVATTVKPGDVSNLRLARFEIGEPNLWSPENPYLYRVICTLREGSRVLDRLEYPLGLRWIEFDAQTGFRLNGKPYRLFGTNRHQDYPGLGNALPNERHRSDLRKIKSNGFNFLRLAHYPQDPAVLETADEIGLLVWEETPIVNLIGLSAAFRKNSTRMVREMIHQHRHHPSVIFWGYMNEVTLVDPEPLPEAYDRDVLSLAQHLDTIAHAEDPLRPTVMALSRDELDQATLLPSVPDIVGLNLYFGWYYGELDSLGPFLDRYHRQNPDMPLFISEYGAGSDARVHSLRAERFDFSAEYQQRFHEAAFEQIRSRPWLIGSAVWAQFDFGSNHRQDTIFGINQKGLWTYDRKPKDIAGFYQAQLRDEPVLRIAARDWLHRAGSRPEDAIMPIRIYSNESPVELFVNGASLGSRVVHNSTAVWNVEFTPGENTLVARSATRADRVTIDYEDRGPLFTAGSASPPGIAASAGSNEQFIDQGGVIWEADRAYEHGSWGHLGGTSERSHQRIFGTDDDPLYQTRRAGAHEYRFDVADGRYVLGLHFARWKDAGPGNDGFRVEINGLSRDVSELAPYTRHRIELPVEVSGGQGLGIRLVSEPGAAFVNGIFVQRIDDTRTDDRP